MAKPVESMSKGTTLSGILENSKKVQASMKGMQASMNRIRQRWARVTMLLPVVTDVSTRDAYEVLREHLLVVLGPVTRPDTTDSSGRVHSHWEVSPELGVLRGSEVHLVFPDVHGNNVYLVEPGNRWYGLKHYR